MRKGDGFVCLLVPHLVAWLVVDELQILAPSVLRLVESMHKIKATPETARPGSGRGSSAAAHEHLDPAVPEIP